MACDQTNAGTNVQPRVRHVGGWQGANKSELVTLSCRTEGAQRRADPRSACSRSILN
jgi:hypothetical protein